MKRITLALLTIIAFSLFFSSCGNMEFDNAQLAKTESAPLAEDSYEESTDGIENRKVVKTASISLDVDQLETAIVQLKSFLKPIGGYVYNYEINNHSYEADHFQKNMDSTVSVQKVSPEGSLSVRVPIAHADSFINYVLQSDAQISSLRINDDDITENLWEKKQIAQVYTSSQKTKKSNSKNISYNNNTSIDAIKAKALAAKMDYKTKYLWFDINLSAKPFYKSTTTIAAKNYRTPIHIAFANAAITGWHICEDIILALVTIWPIMILLGLILFFLRKYRLRHSS